MLNWQFVVERPMRIEAVQIPQNATEDDLLRIAEWCKGTVTISKDDKGLKRMAVRLGSTLQREYVFAGDWIVGNGFSFMAYSNTEYQHRYVPVWYNER